MLSLLGASKALHLVNALAQLIAIVVLPPYMGDAVLPRSDDRGVHILGVFIVIAVVSLIRHVVYGGLILDPTAHGRERWIEYSITAPLVMASISLLSRVDDTGVALSALLIWITILCGWYDQGSDFQHEWPLALGFACTFVAFVFPVQSLYENADVVPDFVFGITGTLFVLFLSFGVVAALCHDPYHYIWTPLGLDVAYALPDLLSKQLLYWITAVGVVANS